MTDRADLINWLRTQAESDVIDGMFDSSARHNEAADELQRLCAIIDDLPKYDDGTLFDEYQAADGTVGWAVWRYPDEARNVSRCHRPEDPDEYNTVFCWIIDDCDDECEVLGVYSTREEAEKARAG